MSAATQEQVLAAILAQPAMLDREVARRRWRDDPLTFARECYPWRRPGTILSGSDGPDAVQARILSTIGAEVRKRRFDGRRAVEPVRLAVASGHGIGKSVLCAIITDWILVTRPNSIGTVTANTFAQLESKTWATIMSWSRMCAAMDPADWDITASKITRRGSSRQWFVTPQTCREENSEAFAGQHAASSTSFYIFDEGSAVPDSIYAVAEGGLTDGEPMIFLFGNPTRNTGKLFRVVFGDERNRWQSISVDSRESSITNQETIAAWLEEHGEDSDFFRVRVRGLHPRQGDMQFIDLERIADAQKRDVVVLPDEPLIAGVDVARGGEDYNVIRFRRGLDARSIPAIRIPGEQTRDTTLLIDRLAQVLEDKRPERKVAMMFMDSALGGPAVNRLQQLGYKQVQEVNFGSAAPDEHCANMRAYMWLKMKDWLLNGAIDKSRFLETDLSAPGYKYNNRERLLLEPKESMKARGLGSPDDGDALALTFARPVAAVRKRANSGIVSPNGMYTEWS